MDSHIIFCDEPEPLKTLALNKLIKEPANLRRYIHYMSRRSPLSVLPKDISDLIAVAFRQHALKTKLSKSECNEFFRLFKHKYMPLTRIDFSRLPVGRSLFIDFLDEYRQHLSEINILECPRLQELDLTHFNKLEADEAKTLIIGRRPLTSRDPMDPIILKQERIFDDDFKIKKLVIHDAHPQPYSTDEFSVNQKLTGFLTQNMRSTLKYLDLSYCTIGKGSALMHLESLEALILYDCLVIFPDVISTICQLKKLRTLDISRHIVVDDDTRIAPDEGLTLLEQIVHKLPLLERLDISGTDYIGSKDKNISVFESRVDRPFKFLGLLHTGSNAAYRSCTPARIIAGEATEEQILNACEAYMERPEQLVRALNELYELYKIITPIETFTSVDRALDIVLTILPRHISEQQIIVYTTAILWCIGRINVTAKKLNDAKVRRNVLRKLLDVMHYNTNNDNILTNGSLTIMNLPEIICEHSRVASISLVMCESDNPRTQHHGTTLLNTLACQVGNDQKVHIGELRAIEIMTKVIKTKIKEDTCDDILETAWSTLWNITDETPVNCSQFLKCDGFEAFEQCMDKFSANKEVLRNIMGLLGNVAECQELRKEFMQARFIRRFESLLKSSIDGIECSYNACGILAHLVSDGQEFWDRHLRGKVERQEITDKMVSAIDRWPINTRRNINYRSFEPIVRLLTLDVAPAAQYWAVFALANLTRINPVKYCEMLLPFGGLYKLRCLAANPQATEGYVSNLAIITLYQYERFEKEHTLAGLEQCDSVELDEIKNFRAESNNSGDGTIEMNDIML